MPGWDQAIEAVKEVGFPAVVCLIVLLRLEPAIRRMTNDLVHEVREMKEAVVALLEHYRNGPPPPPMV